MRGSVRRRRCGQRAGIRLRCRGGRTPCRNRPLSGREGFAERRAGLPLDAVLAEAGRCLTCGGKAVPAYTDDCMTCYTCEVRCPAGAVDVHPFKERLPRTLDTVRRETMHAAAAKEEKRA